MTDRYNYMAPARVKVLVVPVSNCSVSNYEQYLSIVRSTYEVRLLDVNAMPECHYFNPQTFPNGRVMFDFSSSYPEDESIFLHDFEPFRKTFIVLGIGQFNSDLAPEAGVDLKKQYPSSIVQNCILFDTPKDQIEKLSPASDHSAKQTFYHQGEGDSYTAIETIMCDITKNFLLALDKYASSYLNITLRSPVSITDSHILTKAISQAQKRLSSGGTSTFKTATSAVDIKSKAQQKHSGRQAKLMGSFYLLSGKALDAMHHFVEAIVNLKRSDDYLWLGSALDGLGVAVVMLQFLNVPYQLNTPALLPALQITKSKLQTMSSDNIRKVSTESSSRTTNRNSVLSPRNSNGSIASFNSQITGSATDLSSIPLQEFIKLLSSKILLVYQSSTTDYENTVPDIVYVEYILRTIKFMVCVYLRQRDVDEILLEAIVRSNKAPEVLDNLPHGNNSCFSRSEILNQINKVFSLQLIDMSFIDQCRIYSCLASVYSDLGLKRKRAFILRILLVSLLPKFENELPESKKVSGLSSMESVRRIFNELFSIYGINSQPESTAISASHHSSDWISLQLELLNTCVRILEGANDYPYLVKVASLLLTRFTHCLTTEDQVSLKNKIESIINISDRENLGIEAYYWDPFLVRRVKYVSNKSKCNLIPFNDYEKSLNNVGLVDSPSASNGALIFNPYDKGQPTSTVNREKLLIMDDVYQLKVSLQNPFDFEIELSNLSIATEGDVTVQTLFQLIKPVVSTPQAISPSVRPPLNPRPVQKRPGSPFIPSNQSSTTSNNTYPLLIAPRSIQQFMVYFKPLSPGELNISGFDISIGSCSTQFFQIIDKEVFEVAHEIKTIGPEDNLDLIDNLLQNLSNNNIENRATTKTLQLTVVPPQPTLSLTDLLINNGWLMLLEGEKYEFSLCLTNYSDESINYLSFSFWDSTIDSLSNRLSTANASTNPSEAYELEWMLLKLKPFRILNKDEISSKYKIIPPHNDLKISYEITGKRGMKEAKIILDYSHKVSDLAKSFVKNINLPLNLTIMPSVEVIGCDFLPLLKSSFEDHLFSELSHPNLAKILSFINDNVEKKSNYCLMIIDLKNSWSEKLIARLDLENFEIEETIDSLKTKRFFIPVKRISIGDVDYTKPIPSLRNKQFIKNYNISEEEESRQKQLFWLRHSILGKLRGYWQSENSDNKRFGDIDLRTIRLTTKMASVLIYDQVQILQSLYSQGKLVERQGLQYQLEIEEFYTLKTKLVNESNTKLDGILRHIPFPLATSIIPSNNSNTHIVKSQISTDRRILVNGMLQRHIANEPLEPGHSVEIDLSFVILEKGEYEWGTVLDLLDDKDSKIIGREPIYISAL